MIKADRYYLDNLRNIIDNGNIDFNVRPKYKDGCDANTLFVTQVFEKYDISKGEFPITTLRNTATRGGIKEIYWIYSLQSNDLDDLADLGVTWWDSWNIGDTINRHIGERYGKTIKNWSLMDNLLLGLERNPFGRRHIMNMWQESDLQKRGGLDECAYETLWSCRKVNGEMFLDMTLVQRSSDYITAGHINKIQYVALQMMVACHLGYNVGTFCHLVQNLHIYDRHIDAAKEILNRGVIETQPSLILKTKNKTNFYDIKPSDFDVVNIDGINKIKSKIEIAI